MSKSIEEQENPKIWRSRGQPFAPGAVIKGQKIIAVGQSMAPISKTSYRVLSLNCQHESLMSHSLLLGSRAKTPGLCVECVRARNNKKMKLVNKNPPGRKGLPAHPDRGLILWAHSVWR
jgi:hypothetical protein